MPLVLYFMMRLSKDHGCEQRNCAVRKKQVEQNDQMLQICYLMFGKIPNGKQFIIFV
jgi:hypothetical protein